MEAIALSRSSEGIKKPESGGKSTMRWHGQLMTSFQMTGSLHFSLELTGYPDVGETNKFLERLEGKTVRVTVEEVLQ